MNKSTISARWQKIEQTLGGLKFAVVIIVLFILAMIVGTFVESYHGTEFANRLIYKSAPFMLIQVLLFICVTYAALLRLPPKKRLYGFYLTHLGLILTVAGSFVTYYSGIDGSLTLKPTSPSRFLTLPQDVLYITFKNKAKEYTYRLPYEPFATDLKEEFESVKLKKFLPSATTNLQWENEKQPVSLTSTRHSSQYRLSNPNVTQEFVLSLHPQAIDFEASMQLGPLGVHYLPQGLFQCFSRTKASGFILWNDNKGTCSIPEERGIEIKTTDSNKRFLLVEEDGARYAFFPDLSPWPIDTQLAVNQSSPIRIFSQNIFNEGNHLFLFGEGAAFKYQDKWTVENIEKNKPLSLPWMGLELELLYHSQNQIPSQVPQFILPIQDSGQVIKGDQKAVLVEIAGKEYWVKSTTPIAVNHLGENIQLQLGNRVLKLPYEFNLTNFKMDTNPGTQDPASYESFVELFSEEGTSRHHIFMNNPLQFGGFTFYQASYFQTEQGQYGSVLSVNYDPGRWLKYLGALLIVLGATLHFYLNKSKVKGNIQNEI